MTSRGTKKPNSTHRAQLRRPLPKGLAQGESLSRAPLVSTTTFSEWGWVGTEIHSATDIGPQHRAAACGFRKHICKNRHAPTKPRTSPVPEPAQQTAEDDIVVISSDDETECSLKACKTNPNCCNYLGQHKWENEGSARKLFLEAAGLGRDPQEDTRDVGLPVGLKNLGATCYANAFIQVWFQDLAFRAGVYKCIPELSLVPGKSVEDSPVYQLQITFGALQQSCEKSFNPVKFVECLGIRAAEQQDAQEFSKLFMSHLDNEFKKQHDIPLRSLITDQFEGRQVYGTRCATCQKSSEHQSSFLELEISLTADCKLEDRLAASLEDEKLDGDNQYHCSTCDSKQDAFRYTRLTHLPPVLHFSVLRFVFDAQDMSRKKSKQAITFPLAINMRRYVGESDTDLWYDLRGVLLHRGLSAYHGHYEAQVFDVTRDKWFLFNDEEVRENQIGELLGKQVNGNSKSQGSKDAYMLIYARRNEPPVDVIALGIPSHARDAVESLNAAHTSLCDAYTQKQTGLESDFKIARNQKQAIYRSWEISRNDEVSMVLSKSDLESWVCGELNKNGVKPSPPPAVDSAAAQAENTASGSEPPRPRTSSSPPPVEEIILGPAPAPFGPKAAGSSARTPPTTGSQITCVHGLLNPAESANMKRISRAAWEDIKKYGTNAVAIESNQICEDCTANQFNEKLYALQHSDIVGRFEASMAEDKSRSWWISKAWLKDWKLKRPKMHSHGHRDPLPNTGEFHSDVYCEHECLTHMQKSREKISVAALEVLQEIFPEFQPPSTETETCAVCEALAASGREASKEARAKAEVERSRLGPLSRRELSGSLGVVRLVDGLVYALIPLSFVSQWRSWLTKPLVAPRPGPIANDVFICEHGSLLIDPREESDMDGIVCAITVDEWHILHDLYDGGPFIECSIHESGESPGKDELDSNIPLCNDCRTSRLANFSNADINVYRLAEGEPVPGLPSDPTPSTPPKTKPKAVETSDIIHIDDTDIDSPTLSDASPPARAPGSKKRIKQAPVVTTYAGQRKSKRIRTAAAVKRGTTFSVNISKDDTIRDIKEKIHLTEDVYPYYQQLYLRGVELTDPTQTVLQIGLLRTDRLVLRAIEAMDEDDAVAWALSAGDVEPKSTRPRAEGRAFGGTLLDGSMYAIPNEAPPKPKSSEGDSDHPMASAGPSSPDGKAIVEDKVVEKDPGGSDSLMLDETTISSTKACWRCTLINPSSLEECMACEALLSI